MAATDQPSSASVAEHVLACFRKCEALKSGTIGRQQLIEVLVQLDGALAAAEVERWLVAKGFPGAGASGDDRIDIAAFVSAAFQQSAWTIDPDTACFGMGGQGETGENGPGSPAQEVAAPQGLGRREPGEEQPEVRLGAALQAGEPSAEQARADACKRPPAGSAADALAPSDAQQRTTVDYNDVTSLWEALTNRDVLLVRGSWLVAQADLGRVLPRRQECPAEAAIELAELQGIYEKCWAKGTLATSNLAPIVAVSHFWRERHHPDSCGETLRVLGKALKKNMCEYRRRGLFEVGVFLDWCSLYQAPRSEAEDRCFVNSLKWINIWYAHSLTTVYLVTDTPEGIVPYHDRGWTSFEFHLTWLIKKSDRFNVWPQVVNLGSEAQGRPALAPPDAFYPGRAFGDKSFTNGADRAKVARKFKETCREVFGSATNLDFSKLAWGDTEVAALGAVFPLCQRLGHLMLMSNPFSSLPESVGKLGALKQLDLIFCDSLAGLPESIGKLGALERLDLGNCASLAGLPESLGKLGALQLLELNGCASLAALPESIGKLGALKRLSLFGCASLASLPESFGDLGALQLLNLNRCASLAALPESLGELGALKQLFLRGCASLASLPESIGKLGALERLNLNNCASLASLPESLGDLGALKRLDLDNCASLAALPESLGELGALERLGLNGCASLASLPESLGELGALKQLGLRGCASLASLPESIGKLGALEELYLNNCASLASLPESLGDLGALKQLDLRGCASLACLPESLERLKERGCSVVR